MIGKISHGRRFDQSQQQAGLGWAEAVLGSGRRELLAGTFRHLVKAPGNGVGLAGH